MESLGAMTLIGQDYILHFLKRMGELGTLPHSLLITGARGTGKKTLAQEIARGLLCEEGKRFQACLCVSCKKVGSGNHPDLRWYGLDEGAPSIRIAEVQDLIHWMSLKPFEGRAKIFILNGAERMTEEAANALLKTLEEPPPESYIFLLAESKYALLDTMTSRCLEIKVRSLGVEKLQEILERDKELSKEEAHFLARHSKGSLGEALDIKKEGMLREKKEIYEALFDGRVHEMTEQWVGKKRAELLSLLDLLSGLLRDLWVWKGTGEQDLLWSLDVQERIACFSETRSRDQIQKLFEATETAKKSIQSNVNPKIALFELALQFGK